jgi:dimethylhistidine N-methyltransferase
MTATNQYTVLPIAEDVYAGLTREPKRLPARLFYDAAGSALFEEITRLPEYYLTRTEAAILTANAHAICRRAGKNVTLIELAAGSAEKTRLLLAELLRRQLSVVYAPVDVSPAALSAAQATIAHSLPRVRVQPILSELADLAFLAKYGSPRLVLFIGSTIGNLEDDDAITLLRRLATQLGPDDRLLLGNDLVKDVSVLLPAYNDAQGVTARFNRNVLARINRELGGTFDPNEFTHVACWNAARSRIEMHLESRRDQTVHIHDLGLVLEFAAGERIHTENSYKYTRARVSTILASAGFELEHTWSDEQGWYAVHLAHLR